MNNKILLIGCLFFIILATMFIYIIARGGNNVNIPEIADVSLYDENGCKIVAEDGWYEVTPQTEIKIKIEFEGEVEQIYFFITPTGTETSGIRKQIGYASAYNNDSTGELGFGDNSGMAEFTWNVPSEGFIGHLGIELIDGTIAKYESNILNITNSFY